MTQRGVSSNLNIPSGLKEMSILILILMLANVEHMSMSMVPPNVDPVCSTSESLHALLKRHLRPRSVYCAAQMAFVVDVVSGLGCHDDNGFIAFNMLHNIHLFYKKSFTLS